MPSDADYAVMAAARSGKPIFYDDSGEVDVWATAHSAEKTVYLAGPINGCTDDEANGWRQGFIDRHNYRCWDCQRQSGQFHQAICTVGEGYIRRVEFLDPMRRDYRGKEDESVDEIVELDIKDIDECDVFLAYCWQVSWGTAMEIFYAYNAGKWVIVVIPEGQRISPWLRYHSHQIFSTLDEVNLP